MILVSGLLRQEACVGFADFCGRVVVQEGQEGVALAARDLRDGVKQRAGEDDGASGGGLEVASLQAPRHRQVSSLFPLLHIIGL